MGASWGDHPGHLVVPSSVTDVELYLFGKMMQLCEFTDPNQKMQQGNGVTWFFGGVFFDFFTLPVHTPKKMSENFGVGKSNSTLSPMITWFQWKFTLIEFGLKGIKLDHFAFANFR